MDVDDRNALVRAGSKQSKGVNWWDGVSMENGEWRMERVESWVDDWDKQK